MNPWHLRSWLLQQPKPAVVRVTTANGDIKELDSVKRTLVRVAESVVALDPELIECLSSDGQLLRVMRPGSPETQTSEAPPIPAAIANDPYAALISLFAQLIHRSYEHSTEIAFNKIVELVERMGERSDAIEKRLERTEAAFRREQSDRIDELWDRAEEMAQQGATAAEGSPRDQIIMQMLQGFLAGRRDRAAAAAGGATTPPETPPNGGKAP